MFLWYVKMANTTYQGEAGFLQIEYFEMEILKILSSANHFGFTPTVTYSTLSERFYPPLSTLVFKGELC